MNDAPKKIWFDLEDCSAGPVPFNDDEVLYIRADIFDELVRVLEGLIEYAEGHDDFYCEKERAALAKARGE